MNIQYPMLAVLMITTMTSCSPDATTTARIGQLEKKLDAQNAAIAQFERTASDMLDKKVNTMAQSLAEYVAKLESDVRGELSSLKRFFYGEKTAKLDPASKGYSSVSTDQGMFLFSVAGAEPFLDGHKIILEIGNPMNMTFSGFKLKVRHGRRPPAFPPFEVGDTNAVEIFQKWAQDTKSWEKTLRKTEFSFTDSLQPGTWNKVDFTLKETKPEDVAYLEISIEIDKISLRKPVSDLK